MTSWLRPGLRLPLTSRHAFSLHRNARVNHVPIFASTLCAGSTRAYTSPSLSTAAGAHSQPGMAGIAFDIDGVLKLGSKVIEGAPEAVQRITPKHLGGTAGEGEVIPYIFLTNGGGVPETTKAEQLSQWLGVQVSEEQVVISSSPMRALAEEYKDRLVLIAGMHNCKEIALRYGFRKIVTPSEIAAQLPQCTPHCSSQDRIDHAHAHSTPPAHAQAEGGGAGGWVVEDGLEVAAVLVMHDPRDWYRDLQIISDLLVFGYSSALTSSAGKDCASDEGDEGDAAADIDSEGRAAPALYFSNPDFLFSGEHPSPRLAQGAFRVCLEALYRELTGRALQYTDFGKPNQVTYQYAEQLIRRRAEVLGLVPASSSSSSPMQLYGIGDNPAADIRGANRAGEHWKSVLVQSGTIDIDTDPGTADHTSDDVPDFTCKHVLESVDMIQSMHSTK